MFENRNNLQHGLLGLLFLVAFVLMSFAVALGQASDDKSRPVARLVFPPTKDEKAKKESKAVNTSSSESKPTDSSTPKFTPTEEEKKILELVNKEREKLNLAPLRLDPKLCLYARSYSQNMAKKEYLNHTSPEGKSMKDRVREAGLSGWKAIGENIAYNQGYDDPAAFAVERWMISSGHRANILRSMWSETGIGVAKSSDGTFYFTQVFIAR